MGGKAPNLYHYSPKALDLINEIYQYSNNIKILLEDFSKELILNIA